MIYGVLVGIICVMAYVIFNLTRKLEYLEQFISDLVDEIGAATNIIREVDLRGAFEASDEVGSSFEIIKNVFYRLQSFRLEEEE